jgi:hypothetical protein
MWMPLEEFGRSLMRVRANDHVGTHLIACIFDAALRDFFGLAERSAHADDCPGMQLSFLFDCDDVALPALKLDPDTELARVVPADVEVRQRAVLHDVECSRDDRF